MRCARDEFSYRKNDRKLIAVSIASLIYLCAGGRLVELKIDDTEDRVAWLMDQ